MTVGISSLVAIIRQSIIINKQLITLNYSRNNLAILRLLLVNGYIKNYKLLKHNNKSGVKLIISLKLDKFNTSAVTGIAKISTIEKNLYFKKKLLSKHRQNLSNFVFKSVATNSKSNNVLFVIS
jgi:ribosomal protein S8